MFSNCDLVKDEDCIKKLRVLGATLVNDPIKQSFNILVMDYFSRKFKVLVAIMRKALIVSKEWILTSLADNTIVNPYEYFLQNDKYNLNQIFLESNQQADILFDGFSFFIPEDSGIEKYR